MMDIFFNDDYAKEFISNSENKEIKVRLLLRQILRHPIFVINNKFDFIVYNVWLQQV